MNYDYDKLQDTLEYIKEVCETAQRCAECPLGGRKGICRLGICPKYWTLRHPDTDVFRIIE